MPVKLTERQRLLALIGVVAAIVAVVVALMVTSPGKARETDSAASGSGAQVGKLAPEIIGISAWLNAQPLMLKDLRGKVVLVDFWTYTCVDCVRTLPYLTEWHKRYADRGLVIVGVHTPEFDFERDVKNVEAAARRYGVTYPVALDNARGTWDNYRTQYWPRKFLVDSKGIIRYDHIGEGRYEATESQIKKLLAEIGANVNGMGSVKDPNPGPLVAAQNVTPELYAGARGYFQAQIGNVDQYTPIQPVDYTLPAALRSNVIYMSGLWKAGEEGLYHARGTDGYVDEIVVKYFARSANLVIQPQGDHPFDVRITFDGKPLPEHIRGKDVVVDAAGDTVVRVREARLYNLVSAPEIGAHELRLSAKSKDFAIFAFTFGTGEQD